MSEVKVARKQLQYYIDQNTLYTKKLFQPRLTSEGWIKIMRQGLGMSGVQLARRMNVTRALVSNTEKAETEGGVTIKKMQEFAEAMDCEFVYCFTPKVNIETIIKGRATEKANAVLDRTNRHMALEDQSLNKEQKKDELDRMTDDFLKDKLSDLWND